MGEWRYSSSILDLGIRRRRVVSFMPRPVYSQEKSTRYPLDKGVGWIPQPVWTLWRRE
jgi:hypothetical protein